MENNSKKNLYDTCLHYLDITFLNEELKQLIISNSTFSSLVEKMISIIYYYEDSKIIDESNYNRLETAYKINTKKEDFSVFKDWKNDSDFDEIIGYFPILINNSLNKSIQDIENSMTGKSSENVVDALQVKQDQENIETPMNESDVVNSINNFMNGFNMAQLADSMVQQAGEMVLANKIMTGEVYRFSSKPKIIPITKYLISALFILIPILLIASFGIMASLSGKLALVGKDSNNQQVLVFPNTFNWTDILNLVIYIGISAMIIYSLIKTRNNDNFKYRLNWASIAIYLFIAWISFFMKAANSIDPVFHWDNLSSNINETLIPPSDPSITNPLYHPENKDLLPMLDAYRGVQFTFITCLALITVLVILGAVFNPKPDVNRLQQLLQKYTDDIRNGRIDFDQSNKSQSNRFGNGIL